MELENGIANKEGLESKPQIIKQLELKIKRLNKKIDSLDLQEQDDCVLDFLLTCLDNLTLELVATECVWHQELAELQHGSPILRYEVISADEF